MASVVQLADEVLVGVLSWLSADGLVLSRQVCQDWLRVADDDLLWRPLVTSVLPKDEAWAAQLGGRAGGVASTFSSIASTSTGTTR
ncbi:uncharacterized protein ACA1_335880, partial [Acanthamoeba castellanii str. Neff]